jgi:prepilin-type N-terminal cleavage/methylation domain-containing protein
LPGTFGRDGVNPSGCTRDRAFEIVFARTVAYFARNNDNNSANPSRERELDMRSTISRRAGFTLVEIMIVVAIIGLLAAVAIPNLVKARKSAQKTACIGNLKAIEGAKATWALENRKSDTDVPSDTDLFGTGKDLSRKPDCPGGGTYSINAVSEKPTCTIPEHALP